MFGADYAKGPLVAGLSLSNSRGLGEYAGVTAGQVASAVTGLYPWLGYKLSDRVSVWGVTGYGKGALTLTPGEGAALTSGLSMAMGAAGTRGALVGGGASGFELAFKADALWVGTSIDGVEGPDGNLTATAAAVTRFRTGLEAARGYALAGRLSLRPSIEVGLRHDGGDAETGAGLDVGGGLVMSDASTGLAIDLRVRMLVMHQADGFRERGIAFSAELQPNAIVAARLYGTGRTIMGRRSKERGRSNVGPRDNGADWRPRAACATGTRLDDRNRLRTPGRQPLRGNTAGGCQHRSEYGQDYRVGYGLQVLERDNVDVELGVDAERRETPTIFHDPNSTNETQNRILGRATVRW